MTLRMLFSAGVTPANMCLLVALCSVSACRGQSATPPSGGYDQTSTFKKGPEAPAPVGACLKVESENLRARKATLSGKGPVKQDPGALTTVTREKLWTQFVQSCGMGSCHVAKDGARPNPMAILPAVYTVSAETFHQRGDIGSAGLFRILTTDVNLRMPQANVAPPREPGDPIRLFGEQLRLWEEAGFPATFTVQTKEPVVEGGEDPSQGPYLLSATTAQNLTNLGSCIPSPKLEKKMEEASSLDAKFAKAKSIDDLPETLAETDLISLDSVTLAQRAVYSYAPTYTLFSDHASKMRYVRVPMGTKITYNEATKDFDIPANTRFYKTFLRKVTDKDGEIGYRKMETRLILSRPDEPLPDGTYKTTALMVVYAWDKDERMARKVKDQLTNGKPWADRLCPYIEDERETRDAKKNPISPDTNEKTCTYMTEGEVEDLSSGKLRHYAIPSQERCVQCHMGSNNHSFILGFTPWQVDRRKPGEGGTYEPAHEDELDQLQRLIDYGVISGIAPGVAKLEESQGVKGDRKPRNDHELTAQGYMMGNCAFCHNPNGFPTVENPVLKDFELFPSKTGGVFQFELEKFSARAKLGPTQSVRFPYITPVIGDFAEKDVQDSGVTGASSDSHKTWSPATVAEYPTIDWLPTIGDPTDPLAYNDADQDSAEFDVRSPAKFNFIGPWRSLIWRNVATPFTYEEDNTVFIHMPRNVPGFDCRAKSIMAKWMLSIPSVPKPYVPGGIDPITGMPTIDKPGFASNPAGFEQPYLEVRPGDMPYANAVFAEGKDVVVGTLNELRTRAFGYDDAVLAAEKRVANYLGTLVGQDCPDDEDIVDALVINEKSVTAPIDEGKLNGPRVNPAAQGQLLDKVPDHAHWVPIDTTGEAGIWQPRRKQWKEILVDKNRAIDDVGKLEVVIDELRNLYLSPAHEKFSTELLPMGLWHKKCASTPVVKAAKTVSDFRAQELSAGPNQGFRWLFAYDEKALPVFSTPERLASPVHEVSRGESAFRATCMNCHGKEIDSRSPLATTILELSGGEAKVANFRDGLFGPRTAPGQFAEAQFAKAGGGGTPADWQARYMAFMGLGGTQVKIPPIALQLVGTSPFYGSAPSSGQGGDANMLQSARNLCANVLDTTWDIRHFADEGNKLLPLAIKKTGSPFPFVRNTGHHELWSSLCGFQNAPMVRVLDGVEMAKNPPARDYVMFRALDANGMLVYQGTDNSGKLVYPPTHPVGTLTGTVEKGIQPSNMLPWCVSPPTAAFKEEARKHFRASGIDKEEDMPFCPPGLLTKAFGKPVHEVRPSPLNPDLETKWTLKGAINTGVAAYYYMDGFTKGRLKPQPLYDECTP